MISKEFTIIAVINYELLITCLLLSNSNELPSATRVVSHYIRHVKHLFTYSLTHFWESWFHVKIHEWKLYGRHIGLLDGDLHA